MKIIAFQQKEIEFIGEMNRQGLRFITAILMKIFAKNKMEFMGYTEKKLESRIKVGKQADIMDGILDNKEGIVGRLIPKLSFVADELTTIKTK